MIKGQLEHKEATDALAREGWRKRDQVLHQDLRTSNRLRGRILALTFIYSYVSEAIFVVGSMAGCVLRGPPLFFPTLGAISVHCFTWVIRVVDGIVP